MSLRELKFSNQIQEEQVKSVYHKNFNYIITERVVEYAKKLKPSKRGELEIVDIHQDYLKENQFIAGGEFVFKGFLNIKNPLRIDDFGTWDPTTVLESLLKKGIKG